MLCSCTRGCKLFSSVIPIYSLIVVPRNSVHCITLDALVSVFCNRSGKYSLHFSLMHSIKSSTLHQIKKLICFAVFMLHVYLLLKLTFPYWGSRLTFVVLTSGTEQNNRRKWFVFLQWLVERKWNFVHLPGKELSHHSSVLTNRTRLSNLLW